MKRINLTLKTCAFLVFSLFLLACEEEVKPPPEPGPAEEILANLMAQTWAPGDILRDDVDITSEFADFEISFTGAANADGTSASGTFNTVGIDEVLPSGNWELDAQNPQQSITLSSIPTEYALSNNSLQLTFTLEEADASNGRTLGVDGTYEFNLIPKQ